MPSVGVGIAVLGAHRGGRHGGPAFPVVSEPAVQLVADRERVVEVERDEGGRDVAGEVLDDDADLLHIGLDVVGRQETDVGADERSGMARMAVDNIRRNFSKQVMTDRTLEVYAELVRESRGPARQRGR